MKDFTGEVRNWERSVKEQGDIAWYESSGEKAQQRLKDLKGDVSSLKLSKVYPPDGGLMGKLNESVLVMQTWMDEERALTNPSSIIQDRLIFAATNYAPILSLRDRMQGQLSAAMTLVARWKREWDREMLAKKVADAEAARKAEAARRTAARTELNSSPGQEASEPRFQAANRAV